jgi:hypothetical protein
LTEGPEKICYQDQAKRVGVGHPYSQSTGDRPLKEPRHSLHRQPLHRPQPPSKHMKRPFNPRLILWLLSFILLALGFYGSWIRLWGDQNWFARSGGLVTFIGGWIVLVTEAAEHFFNRQAAADIEWLNNTGPPIVGVERLYDRYTSNLKRAMKILDLSLLGLGTLVWALGDLIQFWPH